MYPNSRLRQPTKIQKQRSPKWPLAFAAVLVLLLVGGGFLLFKNAFQDDQSASNASTPPEETFDKTQYSLDNPDSKWLVVNKKRPLDPKDYTPTSLTAPSAMSLAGRATDDNMLVNAEVAAALDQMDIQARAADINLKVVSAYRSYGTQKVIYESEVRGFGQTQADRESARPGHSEHQTGWAADVGAMSGECEIKTCFADTPEGKWLAANAYNYGFILRYPENKEAVTGYQFEPWHLRYVGTELATEMHRTSTKTLEEFFDLPAAPNY